MPDTELLGEFEDELRIECELQAQFGVDYIEVDPDEEDIWGSSVSDELKAHVIAQLEKYIADKQSIRPQTELDYVDARYAQSCVWQFQQTSDLEELEDLLIYQDTLPREECFAYILEGGDAVGLSLVNGRLAW